MLAKALNVDLSYATENKIPLALIFNKRSKGRYDLDNALAAMKHALDGIAQALRIDDSKFRPVTIDVGESYNDTVQIIIGRLD